MIRYLGTTAFVSDVTETAPEVVNETVVQNRIEAVPGTEEQHRLPPSEPIFQV